MTESSTLAGYLAVLRRRKIILLVPIVLVPLVAVLFSARQRPVYEASADVLLSRLSLSSAQLTGTPDELAAQDPEGFRQTQAQIARLSTVLQHAVRTAGVPGETAAALLASSTVTPQTNANLLHFTVSDPQASRAIQLAEAYARAYTGYRVELDRASLQRTRRVINSRLRRLRRAGRQATSPVYAGLLHKGRQIAVLEPLLTGNASLVQPADAARRVGPRTRRNGILGLLLGTVLGVAFAFVREALDPRIRSYADLEQALGLPLLGRVPRPPRRIRRTKKLVMLALPESEFAEAVLRLKANVELASLGSGARAIMVTSAVPREGKSPTVANLAVALARAGSSVVLTEIDLRRPTVSESFEVASRPGLTDVLAGWTSLEDAMVSVRIPDLFGSDSDYESSERGGEDGDRFGEVGTEGGSAVDANGRPTACKLEVLPAGSRVPAPGEVVGSEALRKLINQLRERSGYLLIDVPPLLAVSDAIALCSQVDAILLVTNHRILRRKMLEDVRRALDVCPVPKLGFVVTDAPREETYGYERRETQPNTDAFGRHQVPRRSARFPREGSSDGDRKRGARRLTS